MPPRLERFFSRSRVISDRILSIVRDAVSSGEVASRYFTSRFSEIRGLNQALKKIFLDTVPAEAEIQYRKSISDTRNELLKFRKLDGPPGRKWENQALNILKREMSLDYFNGIDGGQKDVQRLFRLTQQQNVSELKINQALARGITTEGGTPDRVRGELVRELKQAPVLKDLNKKIVADGKLIRVIDKNGKTRHYTPDVYGDLVARTRIREAQTLATTNTLLDYGHDLVRVSDHDTDCPQCLKIEGLVFSLTGQTPGYPVWNNSFCPLHPNCKHSISPYVLSGDSEFDASQAADLAEQKRRNKAKLEALEAAS